MNKTPIEWCDYTWNPVTGCLHGCEYCYARGQSRRFGGYWCEEQLRHLGANGKVHDLAMPMNRHTKGKNRSNPVHSVQAPYPFGFDPTFHRYRLDDPTKLKTPSIIFVCSMADLFGDWVPDEWIVDVFNACRAAPQHRYLFLTKNPARYVDLYQKGTLPTEHWYGITRDRKNSPSRPLWKADYKFFASYEPLLEEIDDCGCYPWIIIGAESGNRKGKVTTKREWVEKLVCCISAKNNYTKVFMKDSLLQIIGEENMIQEFPWDMKGEV